ncbi:MAG: M50 family metallopeptidase [bacterium]|nr:M50 family metallopeptidase [bacterium]
MKSGHLLGIPVRLNLLFLLSLALYAVGGAGDRALLVLAAVFLHELAHAVLVRGYGTGLGEVELLPFGGVVRGEGILEPEVEAVVALAGPGHNLLLASICWSLGAVLPGEPRLLVDFARANLLMGAFNLIPVLPLDGGRLARAVLARQLGYHPATATLAAAGKVLAAMLALAGLAGAPFRPEASSLAVIALFLYPAADQEWTVARYAATADLVRRREKMVRQGVLAAGEITAPGDTPIGALLSHLRSSSYHVVLVLAVDGSLRGRLSETELLSGLLRYGVLVSIGQLMLGKEASPLPSRVGPTRPPNPERVPALARRRGPPAGKCLPGGV